CSRNDKGAPGRIWRNRQAVSRIGQALRAAHRYVMARQAKEIVMNITGNTILITGGGSGIGRALAEAFHARGNEVLVTGRNPDKLRDVEASNPGIRGFELDVTDPAAIRAFAKRVGSDVPSFNVLVNNAGIMRAETISDGDTG